MLTQTILRFWLSGRHQILLQALTVILFSQAGTGFTDEALAKHHEFFKQHVIEKPRSYYRYGDNLKPDEWFDAVQVSQFS